MRFFDIGPRAEGIIAIGQEATGGFALGQIATGVIAIGQMATGVIAIGQLARGVIAVGQLSFGFVSVGMLSVGLTYSLGLGAGGRGRGAILPLVPVPGKNGAFPSPLVMIGQLALLTIACALYWPLVLGDLGSFLARFARELAVAGIQ